MELLITDIPNSGQLPNNEQESVHQPYFPLLQYKTNLPQADTSLLRTTDSYGVHQQATIHKILPLLTDSGRSLV